MNEVATRSNTDVAVPESNPFASFGDSGTGIVGDLLKFSKGEWLAGQDEQEVPEGAQIVVNMLTVKTGWVRWQDAKPTDEELVTIASGMSPPRRSDLGDNDQDLWEEDKDNKPQWQYGGVEAVPVEWLQAHFTPPWKTNPLADLPNR